MKLFSYLEAIQKVVQNELFNIDTSRISIGRIKNPNFLYILRKAQIDTNDIISIENLEQIKIKIKKFIIDNTIDNFIKTLNKFKNGKLYIYEQNKESDFYFFVNNKLYILNLTNAKSSSTSSIINISFDEVTDFKKKEENNHYKMNSKKYIKLLINFEQMGLDLEN
jgi:hypothetical protein